MKFLVVLLFLLSSLSSFARGEDFSQMSLGKVLKIATCDFKIQDKPIIFAKEQGRSRSGNIIVLAHEITTNLRRLNVDRLVRIQSVKKRLILADDNSIHGFCVLDKETRKCSLNMHKMSLAQIEEQSGQNIKVLCHKDTVTDI